MRSNQPKAKFCLESDSNHHLIDIFDSEFLTLFNWNIHYDTNLDTDFESEFEYDQKFIKFNQKFIELNLNGQKPLNLDIFIDIFDRIQPFLIELDHFWLVNWH